MYCYGPIHPSMCAVDPDYVPQAGETLLDHYPPVPGEIPAYDAALASEANTLANAGIRAQMDAIDGGGQARAVRQALLAVLSDGDQKTRLQAIEDQVSVLRAQLAP